MLRSALAGPVHDRTEADEHNPGIQHRMTADMHDVLIADRPQKAERLSAKDQDYTQQHKSLLHSSVSVRSWGLCGRRAVARVPFRSLRRFVSSHGKNFGIKTARRTRAGCCILRRSRRTGSASSPFPISSLYRVGLLKESCSSLRNGLPVLFNFSSSRAVQLQSPQSHGSEPFSSRHLRRSCASCTLTRSKYSSQ